MVRVTAEAHGSSAMADMTQAQLIAFEDSVANR
jgi:hypothetical protein